MGYAYPSKLVRYLKLEQENRTLEEYCQYERL
jgi:hypothetical protein